MDILLTTALLLGLAASYILWFSRLACVMTGPRMWPLLGSLPGLIHNSSRLHDWISSNLRLCGGTYQTCTCAIPILARRQALTTVTCDPRNLEHILKTHFDNYPKGPTWHAVFHDLLGDGIFNSDGDTWLFQRKTAALEFTTRTLRQAMSRWVTRAIHRRLIPILDEARMTGQPVDLQDLLLRLTFDNICGLTFGWDPETLAPGLPDNTFATAFDRATEASLHRFLLPEFLWRIKKRLGLGMETTLHRSVAHVERYLASIIKARKLDLQREDDGCKHDDLLSRFMRKGSYPDTYLQHVALNFILAGRDTSSVALTWFFWLMTWHREVQDRVLSEICTVLVDTRGDDTFKWIDEELTYEEVERFVYLKAALSETLRLYPSVPEDSKHVVADDTLPDGTFVPAGSAVTYSIYSTGRMPEVWGEDCMEFRPERWLGEKKMEPFGFVAFNGGPRVCLGKELAYLQMRTIAAAVLMRYRLEVEEGHRVEQKMSLTLFMKYGLRVKVSERKLGGVVERVRKERRVVG